MKKIFTFILATAAMLTTTSCLKDEVLVTDPETGVEYDPHFDYSAPKPVIEFMTETNKSTINCKEMSGSGNFFVNCGINYAQDITEDINVTVSEDKSMLTDIALIKIVFGLDDEGAQSLSEEMLNHQIPQSSYSISVESYVKTASGLSLPTELVIPAYTKQNLNERIWWNNRRNAKGTVVVDAVDSELESATYYLPLRITSLNPTNYSVSGNFGYVYVMINL